MAVWDGIIAAVTHRRSGAIALLIAAVYIFGWYIPQFYEQGTTYLWAEALYIGVAAMGLNLLTGYNGQVSIGHGAFFGLGMYTTAILMNSHDWPFLPTVFVYFAFHLVLGQPFGLALGGGKIGA